MCGDRAMVGIDEHTTAQIGGSRSPCNGLEIVVIHRDRGRQTHSVRRACSGIGIRVVIGSGQHT